METRGPQDCSNSPFEVCAEHGQEQSQVCLTCKRFVCLDCKDFAHDPHETRGYKNWMTPKMEIASQMLQTVQEAYIPFLDKEHDDRLPNMVSLYERAYMIIETFEETARILFDTLLAPKTY